MEEDTGDCQKKDNLVVIQDGKALFKESLLPKLRALRYLNLSECALETLPESLGEISSVETLLASHNQLTALPSSLFQLKKLQKLVLSFNKLATLPDSCSSLNELKILDLSHNSFEESPKCFQVSLCLTVDFNILCKVWMYKQLFVSDGLCENQSS